MFRNGNLIVNLNGRPLTRSTRNGWILGVCSGMARNTGLSPMKVRVLLTILAIIIPGFSTIPVFMLYILFGILLPTEDEL